MSDDHRFRNAEGAAELRRMYDALIDEHLPHVVRHAIPTTIGPIGVITAGASDGIPVVLLHGSGATALSWASTIVGLSDEYRVHAVDLPGEPGPSTSTRVPFRANEQADWSAQVVRALAGQPAIVVGVSIGGWIATALAARNPELVAHLVLQSASGFARRRMLPLVLAGVLTSLGERGRRSALTYLTGPHASAPERTPLQRDLDAFALRTFTYFRPRTDLLPEHDSTDLERIRAQVSAAYGARDRMLDARAAVGRIRRLLPTATVELRPGVGHLIGDQAALTRKQISSSHDH
ncbi:alpha/beta fold hydrolase [Gordonia polyisoprenivorans]|uniref:alpha/beta fold hydrolase n=1 Tax=Gordonia polyisoprenivorans TaxID=84595 RepID=UPI001AD632D6|nr:alpha/beta fold hydrolase [Gordonia polyisoprenivorans]QTI69763.1 alpha/beta fold hydrolase [Gordonia polyisoprenivorans]